MTTIRVLLGLVSVLAVVGCFFRARDQRRMAPLAALIGFVGLSLWGFGLAKWWWILALGGLVSYALMWYYRDRRPFGVALAALLAFCLFSFAGIAGAQDSQDTSTTSSTTTTTKPEKPKCDKGEELVDGKCKDKQAEQTPTCNQGEEKLVENKCVPLTGKEKAENFREEVAKVFPKFEPGEIQAGDAVNFDGVPEERGDAAFSDKTLRTPEEVGQFVSTNPLVYERVRQAFASKPDEFERALSGECYVPIQFMVPVDYFGTTYHVGGQVITMEEARRANAEDILWVCVMLDGTINFGASVRADCGNPNFTEIVPVRPGSPPGTPIEKPGKCEFSNLFGWFCRTPHSAPETQDGTDTHGNGATSGYTRGTAESNHASQSGNTSGGTAPTQSGTGTTAGGSPGGSNGGGTVGSTDPDTDTPYGGEPPATGDDGGF